MSCYVDSFDNMLNKKLESVELSSDKTEIIFTFQDGFVRKFGVEGGCCSSSWIEHLERPSDIRGAIITSVNDGGSGPLPGESDHDGNNDDVCIAYYQTIFNTDKGEITLEYRNSSNGYYGGYLINA